MSEGRRVEGRAGRPDGRRPPVLLTMADYPPTLAAVRCLGRAGVPVVLAEWRRLVPARWSRHASRVVPCPDLNASPDAFLAWLLEFGAREPGHVLLPTSDDLAFLYTRHREALSRHFVLGPAQVGPIYDLLNKVRLQEACRAEGIEVPQSWFAEAREDLPRLAGEVAYPVIVKPQTQIFLWPHQKGRVVRGAADLAGLYDDFLASTHHADSVRTHDPGVARPLLQAFLEGASEGIYNLAGFVAADGTAVVAASRKVLQRPRLLGIGLVFEEAPVREELVAPLLAMFRRVGYHGVFEVEYLEAGERRLLIDANPRFYGEMAFEVARGLPLPLLSYLDAVGDQPALAEALAGARAALARGPGGRVYRHWIQLHIYLFLLRAVGRMSAEEHGRWRRWLSERAGRTSDAVHDGDDFWPSVIDTVTALFHSLRHPRSTWRQARES